MTDRDLSSLLAACRHAPDPGTLAALADRLLEVSAADRLEAVGVLADALSRVSACMERTGWSLDRDPALRVFQVSRSEMSDRHIDHGLSGQIIQGAADRLGRALVRGTESGRWYAFRLAHDSQSVPAPHGVSHTDHRFRLSIAPLDGGRINEEGAP